MQYNRHICWACVRASGAETSYEFHSVDEETKGMAWHHAARAARIREGPSRSSSRRSRSRNDANHVAALSAPFFALAAPELDLREREGISSAATVERRRLCAGCCSGGGAGAGMRQSETVSRRTTFFSATSSTSVSASESDSSSESEIKLRRRGRERRRGAGRRGDAPRPSRSARAASRCAVCLRTVRTDVAVVRADETEWEWLCAAKRGIAGAVVGLGREMVRTGADTGVGDGRAGRDVLGAGLGSGSLSREGRRERERERERAEEDEARDR